MKYGLRFLGLLLLCGPVLGQDKRPNIIIMMADDMGFSDVGCYGGEIQTPNIDALATKGLRFTQFRNSSRCCPTRASLMTGLYPHQVGLTRNRHSLTRDGVTIAEALKESGYHTAMVGKWHLSKTLTLNGSDHQKWLDHQIEHGPFGPIESYPANRGFEKFYGIIWGVINYFDPFSLVEGTEPVKEVPEDFYLTDAITDKAIEYISEFSKSDKPFFLYYSQCAPHWPIHALPEDIAKYKETYKEGWEVLRAKRYQRQLDMGLFDKAVTPLPTIMGKEKTWAQLTKQEKAFNSRKMAVHAAMIDRVDQNLGRLLEQLKSFGKFENTVFFFLSDNGASPEITGGPGYDRTSQTRQGQKVLYGNTIPTELLGSELSYTGIGSKWANASNTPFRFWKKESYEGGCNTPFIVHWPKGLKQKGFVDVQGHVIDLMPTCLDLAQANYPRSFQGQKRLGLEGQSLMDVINGTVTTGQTTHCFEHMGGRAVVSGDWKIVAMAKAKKWDLYHLSKDLTETQNLAAQFPDKVKELSDVWQRWADRVGALAAPQKRRGK